MNTLHRPLKRQRGQAMSEFIAAMALFIPLLFFVIYIGKYADIKHQAIQASRYAAMQRALDPRHNRTDTAIQNETVARFFRDGGRHRIARDDKATGPTAGDLNPNWYAMDGKPMLDQYGRLSVTFTTPNPAVSGPAVGTLNRGASFLYNKLDTNLGIAANVKVPVANVVQ